jgi:phytoene synthase
MRDLDLVRLHWPTESRPAFDALMGIEAALDDVIGSSTQPALGAIRLAWWREALERLDRSPPPPEPRLQAVATHLLPIGLGGKRLSELEGSRAVLLDEHFDPLRLALGGERLFAFAAAILHETDEMLAAAGRLYAMGRGKRLGLELAPSSELLAGLRGHRFARRLRPLTGLARLAARDLKAGSTIEPEATPGRAAALLSHRLFGTVA